MDMLPMEEFPCFTLVPRLRNLLLPLTPLR